jgi:integrase
MATIFKYNGKKGITWNVKIRKNGLHKTASFPTKKLAEDWARDTENQIAQEKYFPDAPSKLTSHTTSELINLYIERILPLKAKRTQIEQLRILKWWKTNVGDTDVKHITTALLEDYKATLMRKGYSPGHMNLYLNTLSPCFTLAASPRLGWLSSNPFQHVKRLPEQHRIPRLKPEQIHDLLRACKESPSPQLYVFARLILGTGGRCQEVLQLRWHQVNWRQATLLFLNTKNKTDRVVPLGKNTLHVLSQYHAQMFGIMWTLDDEATSPLFPSPHNPNQPRRTIHWLWKKAREAAGLPWLHIHDLRHVFATMAAQRGQADIADLAQLLGHKSLKYTVKYRHVDIDHLGEKVQKMETSLFE